MAVNNRIVTALGRRLLPQRIHRQIFGNIKLNAASNLATQADFDLCTEAASKFLTQNDLKFVPTSGGVNNIVQYVEAPDNKRYILRIYNNGLNTPRVDFEHAVLSELNKMKFNFEVPTFLKAIGSAKSYVSLSNKAEACMCTVIPGVLPKNAYVEEIGTAAGELLTALGNISVAVDCPTPPYFELYKVHHAISRESFNEVMASTAFDGVRDATNLVLKEIESIEDKISRYHDLKLPVQLIHGDLHYDNVLVHEGKCSGLLDFEFCSRDWRAMELAICLSKYAGEKEALEKFDLFSKGFGKHCKFTATEIAAVPDLINLRVLSNVVYFVGRSIAKEDGIESLTTRIENYYKRVDWINKNSQTIQDLLSKRIGN